MVKSKNKEPKRRNYTLNLLKKAIDEVKSGKSIRQVSAKYQIPSTTLFNKSKQTEIVIPRVGPPTILTPEEEHQLVTWIFHMCECGFLVTKTHLLLSVKLLLKRLKRPNPFTDGCPGRSWYASFNTRHPEITSVVSHHSISKAKATEGTIRTWHSKIKEYLEAHQLIDIDPSRIFNADESAFYLLPKGEKVLVRKGEKSAHSFTHNDEKECLTVLFTFNAKGTVAPPLVLFSYERLPKVCSSRMPADWGAGKTNTGWMTAESFYEYITNVFYPWLVREEVEFPIILYVNGNSSHISLSLTQFCEENKIHLIALFPNATHLLQPSDDAFFEPLKAQWNKVVQNWQMENSGRPIKKEEFAPLLNKTLSFMSSNSTIIPNGFRTAGLHPFSIDGIDFNKIATTKAAVNETVDRMITGNPISFVKRDRNVEDLLETLEKYIHPETLEKFKENEPSTQWDGNVEDTNLFFFWKTLRNCV